MGDLGNGTDRLTSLLVCSLSPGSGFSGLWSLSSAASGFGGGAEETELALFPNGCLGPQGGLQTQPNWPELAGLWECSELGGRRATLFGFLLELGPGGEPRDGV